MNNGTDPVLGEGLTKFFNTPEYAACAQSVLGRTDVQSITSAHEVTAMMWLIRALTPKLCLEIGTFFAGTTRMLTEVLAQANPKGKLVTLDPFGAERVPRILKTWPANLRALVDYKPLNSMDYFVELETQRVPKGAASDLSFVFVDGNHNFEYALFDIIRSADHLKPGGAIVVDNLEQHGPRDALKTFLEWNPSWCLWVDGAVKPRQALETLTEGWGVLLSPQGVGISNIPYKFSANLPEYRPIKGIRLNVKKARGEGQLGMFLTYYAAPYDYHITGTGLELARVRTSTPLTEAAAPVDIRFDNPAMFSPPTVPFNTGFELELGLVSKAGGEYVVLDAKEPYQFLY